jgi:hypothetical protein
MRSHAQIENVVIAKQSPYGQLLGRRDLPDGLIIHAMSLRCSPRLSTLASVQGVEFTGDFDALLGDFWPDDADEFVSAL